MASGEIYPVFGIRLGLDGVTSRQEELWQCWKRDVAQNVERPDEKKKQIKTQVANLSRQKVDL